MRKLAYKEAIAEALVQAMEKDEKVFVIGEGVSDMTGIFGTTLPAHKKFPDRVMDMPLSEALITGVGTGAALIGMRPVMVHARNDFLYLAMDQIVNHAAIWSYMHGGGIEIPWVIRAIIGRGWGNASQHSQSLQAIFSHIPGLRVVMPSTPYYVKGLLIAAIECNSPVMFFEHRHLFDIKGEVPEDYYSLPLEKSHILKEGKDVSFIATSFMAIEAMKATQILKNQSGIQAEVVGVSSIKPLDKETICESVRKTGRAVVLDTSWKSFGVSAEISAMISEECFGELKSPVKRIALPDLPVPCSYALEKLYYPGVKDIINTVLDFFGQEPLKEVEIEEEFQFQGPF